MATKPTDERPALIGLALGERLLILRRRAGLSMAGLEAATGIDQTTLSRYERNIREPRAREVVKLCRALATTPNVLLGYYGPEPVETSADGATLDKLRGLEVVAVA